MSDVQLYIHAITIPQGRLPELEFSDLHTSLVDFLFENTKDFICQLERGEQAGRLHYQLYVKLHQKKRSRTLACDWNCHFPGIHVAPGSTVGHLALKDYCMKEDTRVLGPWGKRPIYTGTDLNCMSEPYDWQEEIVELLKSPADDRLVHYIFEGYGNKGKSKLTKYLCFKKLATRVPLGNATQLKTFVCQAGSSPAYLIDIPRSTGTTERLSDLYSAIEEIKNGFVTSAMYGKMHTLYMDPPHVIVFSNAAPNFHLLSRDKWKVGHIDWNYTINWQPVNLTTEPTEPVVTI